MMNFKATLGLTAWITTAFVTLVLGSIIFLLLNSSCQANAPIASKITGVAVTFLMLLAYGWVYALRPRGYFVADNRIIIDRLVKKVAIEKHQIKDAFIIKKGTLGSLEKNGGNAGLFGFFGEFDTVFGRTMLYGTRLDKIIMIQTFDNQNIILTPDDLTMVAEIKRLSMAESQ